METKDLSKGAKMKASRAIIAVHNAYTEPDGIKQLEEELEKKRGAAGAHIYALAVFAFEQTKRRADAVELFTTMCTYAEGVYKTEHEVVNLKDALPTWSVFKSNILRGLRDYDLDPRKFKSEGAFRHAMQELTPTPTRDETPIGADDEDEVVTPGKRSEAQIDEFLVTTLVNDSLRVLVAQIIYELENLKAGKVALRAAEGVLRDAMNKLQPHVDLTKAAA